MSNQNQYSRLELKDALNAGWFQWYNIKEYTEYPECHVLTYKLAEDCFYSQVLDFDIIASGETALESFENVSSLTLDFLKKYKESDGKIDFQPKGPEYWNKFRELYHKSKLQRFLSQDSVENKKSFPLRYVNMAGEAFETLEKAMAIIDIQEKTISKQEEMIEEKQKQTEVLQAKVRELDAAKAANVEEAQVAEILESEFYN